MSELITETRYEDAGAMGLQEYIVVKRKPLQVMEIDRRLREEGIPLDELAAIGPQRLSPGITVKQFIDTLRTFEKVEEVAGVVKYVPREQEQYKKANRKLWLEATIARERATELERENLILTEQVAKATAAERKKWTKAVNDVRGRYSTVIDPSDPPYESDHFRALGVHDACDEILAALEEDHW